MADKGFAIRCPYCRKWNVWKDIHPDEVALESEDELGQILKGLKVASERGEPDSFLHTKLFRCSNPRWICPSSFEGFVCRSEKDTFKFLQTVDAWSFKRDFRLYKADCQTRWEGKYYGILFCTQAVPWQPDIELESLLERELLSRLIVGMSVEIEAPITVFAANIFTPKENDTHVYWMPIEAYSLKRQVLIPPRFNIFCRTCRGIVMKKLEDRFKREKVSVSNCPVDFGKNGMCAGRKATCTINDWNHCPAFIEERKKCPCYNSDLTLIKKVEDKWRHGGSMEDGVQHRCNAGLLELAFPIVVHDHLVGIVMTGQVFYKPEDIIDIGSFVGRWNVLKGHNKKLQQAKTTLINDELKRVKEGKATSFLIIKSDLKKRIGRVVDNINRMTDVGNSRYRDFRLKTESAFRQEVLGHIQIAKMKDTFFQNDLLNILQRMRKFWAFRGVYLAAYSFKTKKLSVVAFANEVNKEAYGIPGRNIDEISIAHHQEHPCPFIHVKGKELPRDSRLVSLLPIMENAIHTSGQRVLEGERECGALIPFSDEVYTFVFAVRDEHMVSTLERQVLGEVSDLCRDAILETCTQVIYEFGELSYKNARERAWREFSALASHRIGNEINAVGTLIDVLSRQLMADPEWARKWGDKLPIMIDSIKSAKRMLTEQVRLTAEIKPKFKVTNLENLIKRAAVGILPATAKLSFKGSRVLSNIRIDPDLMEQVFRELCVNSVRAGGEAVQITVIVSRDAKKVRISFRDNGLGISDDQKVRIFEPFVTSETGRTGLGLATVSRIVEAHDGGIRVGESDTGANLIITLPFEGE